MYRHRSLFVGIPLLGALEALGFLFRHTLPSAKPFTVAAAHNSTPAATLPTVPSLIQPRLPLTFESNQGQADRWVRFLAHSGDSTLFLTPTEAVFTMAERKPASQSSRGKHGTLLHQKSSLSALRMQLVGADPKAKPVQEQPLTGKINYFVGRDPNRWHTGVPTFGRARFTQVYPGVDVVYYGNQQHLEYDFVVAPHADPKRIKLHFAGTDSVRVSLQGDLIVRQHGRTLTWQKPRVYQESIRGKRAVEGQFRLQRSDGQKQVTFALGHYDPTLQLVIDPILIYSTYIGGTSESAGNAIAVDSQGNAYLTGYTAANDFPVTTGAFQTTNKAFANQGLNAFVTKINWVRSVSFERSWRPCALSGNLFDLTHSVTRKRPCLPTPKRLYNRSDENLKP